MSVVVTINEHTANSITELEALALQEAEDLATAQAEAIKATADAKAEALASLTVTTSNMNTFNGDETARTDMLSAITTSDYLVSVATAQYNAIATPTQQETDDYDLAIIEATQTAWKMANNEWVVITLDELKEALALSIKRKGEILVGGI